MDRRKEPAQRNLSARDAIRTLLNKDETFAANKVLFGIYRKGWSANEQGQSRLANPYVRASPYGRQWAYGWAECSKIMRRRRSDGAGGTA